MSDTLLGLLCFALIGRADSLLLYPAAFLILVLQKAYGIARSSLVPGVVESDEELVEANSKLQLLSGLAVPIAGPFAGIAFAIVGSGAIVGVAVVAYALAALMASRIPGTQVASAPATEAETAELRGIGDHLVEQPVDYLLDDLVAML